MTALPDRYLEAQLRFASTIALANNEELGDVVLRFTNFARRFGFDTPAAAASHEDWHRYVDCLNALPSFETKLEWTVEFAKTRPTNLAVADASSLAVGPFSAEVSGTMVRTHFVPVDTDGLSPLHPTKRLLRMTELVALVDQVRLQYPDVERVRGVSWLYSTSTYRSLFPALHVETAAVRTDLAGFQGSSSWGQFLDHHGQAKDPLIDEFLPRLPTMDPSEPWLAFPVPTMVVDSPLSNFDEQWGSSATAR